MSRTQRLLAESVRSLLRNRVRAAVMLIASTLGVAALIVITAMGRGTQAAVLDNFTRMFAGHTVFLRAGGAEFGPGRGGVIPPTTLTLADLQAIKAAIPAVTGFDPMLMVRRQIATDAGTTRAVVVEGHGSLAQELWARPAARGAFFTAEEEVAAARVALLGEVTARELFNGRDPIGQQIRIGTVPFEIIGIMSAGGVDPHGVDRDDAVWIPITTMQRRVLNVDYIATSKLAFTRETELDAATLEVSDVLRQRHALAPGVANDFSLYTPVAVQERIQQTNRIFTIYLPLATIFAIIVGAFVVANLMFLTVSDRRAEIGLRKALGARAADIRFQFLAESLTITGAAGVLAVMIAATLLAIAPRLSMPSVPLPIPIAALGIAISVFVGAAAGFAPARRAAALDPVEALR